MVWARPYQRILTHVTVLFFIAVALNYLWEIGQSPLYAGMKNWDNRWWHCFVPSLGDGVLLLIIYAIGGTAFARSDWYLRPTRRAYGLMLATGLCLGLGIEWLAIYVLHRWAYAADMPILPGLGVGVVPIVQVLLLPPLVFGLAAKLLDR